MGHALGDHHRGHLHALAAHGRLQRDVAARHRPRRHRDADGGRARAARRRRARAATTSAARRSSSGSGTGASAPATASSSSSSARLLARLGADDLHDGSAVLGGGDRGVRAPPRRGPDLPRAAPHQLVPVVPDRALGPRGRATTRARRASCTSSRTRWPTARARSWSRRRGPRRCWATRRSPSTRTIRATRSKIGKMVEHPLTDAGVPDHRRRDPGRPEVRHRRREGHARRTIQRLRDRPAPQAADDLDLRRGGRRSTPRAASSRAWIASRRARR